MADTATKALEALGKAIKKIGESITENQVAALVDFAAGIGALILVSKGYTFLTGLSTATLSLSTFFAEISAFITGFTITTAILDWTGWDKDLEKFGEDLYDFFHEDVAQFVTNWENFWSGYDEYMFDFLMIFWKIYIRFSRVSATFSRKNFSPQRIISPKFLKMWDLVWQTLERRKIGTFGGCRLVQREVSGGME